MSTPIQTTEILDDAMAAILRQKSPAERLAIANGMWRFARDLLSANIAREHPGWTKDEVSPWSRGGFRMEQSDLGAPDAVLDISCARSLE